MHLKENNAALILIDFQKGFEYEEYWGGNRNNRDAEKNAGLILSQWRELKRPVFHIIHSAQNPNSKLHKSHTGFKIKDEVKPIYGEKIIEKTVNSAFIGTDLKALLEKGKISDIVIMGLTTDHCVSTTARMAGNFGFNVLVISDATATFDRIGINGEWFSAELIHQTALASLNHEFAKVIDSKKLLTRI